MNHEFLRRLTDFNLNFHLVAITFERSWFVGTGCILVAIVQSKQTFVYIWTSTILPTSCGILECTDISWPTKSTFLACSYQWIVWIITPSASQSGEKKYWCNKSREGFVIISLTSVNTWNTYQKRYNLSKAHLLWSENHHLKELRVPEWLDPERRH